MKVKQIALAGTLTLLALLAMVLSGLTQGVGPLLIIQGLPDATIAPPGVRTHVSVIDKSTAQTIEGLMANDFQLEEANTLVDPLNVSYEPGGLAILVVVDRGGISVPGDSRINETTGLVRELADRLTVEGKDADDVIAIVGVGEGGALQPEENFSWSPVDINLVLNALVAMEGETVTGGTPLYEGLDEALRLLTENTEATIRDVLSHRRKVIVVFSDGIDPDYSDSAREEDIIRKAKAAGISLYTIGMARRGSSLRRDAEDNLVRLAHQTDGLYQLYNDDETHQQVLNLFDSLMTQRQQYLLSYNTRRPKGDYTLNVLVDTPIGSADQSVTFSSILETSRIALTAPADGLQVTVPYSRSLEGFVPTTITLRAQVSPVDGVARDPAQVRYFANGGLVGTSATLPDFPFDWAVSTVVTPTNETQIQEYTLGANADDAYLGTGMTSQPVNIRVTWGEKEVTVVEEVGEQVRTNWWLIPILLGLLIGLVILSIMLVRTRGEFARRVVTRTTGVLKGVTRRLGAMPQRAPGKLVVIQGANMGREFRLAAQMVKVGRDPQFCDFALYDEFTSNPHFSIQMEQTQFFITDEDSTNSTRVNGMPIPPHQRMLLQPDAIIEVGQTRLQFKRLGGTTRQLGAAGGRPPGPPSPHAPASPGQTPGGTPPPASPHPPTWPQQPPGGASQPGSSAGPTWPQQSPPGPSPQAGPRRGGPTRQA